MWPVADLIEIDRDCKLTSVTTDGNRRHCESSVNKSDISLLPRTALRSTRTVMVINVMITFKPTTKSKRVSNSGEVEKK